MTNKMSVKEFKANILDNNRPAFELWGRTHSLLEESIGRGPTAESPPFDRALYLFYIQAFKSHGSLYFLCVHGHGEDAATILRRLMEIAFQVRYLYDNENMTERNKRAMQYLSYYWINIPDVIKADIPPERKAELQAQYDAAKAHILNPRGKLFRNWWGDKSIKDLATEVGLEDMYSQDYRLLSQMAHCTAQGIFLQQNEDTIEIRNDIMVSSILEFGTRYVLDIAGRWNDHFNLIEDSKLSKVIDEAVDFRT